MSFLYLSQQGQLTSTNHQSTITILHYIHRNIYVIFLLH